MSTGNVKPKIDASWLAELQAEFQSPWFAELKQFLLEDKKLHTVYPRGDQIFNAFNRTPFDHVKVVIIGQDPYHGPGQAHGLSFSVPQGIKPPPSLVNIFKELASDLELPTPQSGNLEPWADQGVLLLNATLTVRQRAAGSHQGKGWEQFTDAAIRKLSEKRENLVFILWGKFAQAKGMMIDASKHHIIASTHPSPFSAHYGFLGSKPFSRTNAYLASVNKEPINWALN